VTLEGGVVLQISYKICEDDDDDGTDVIMMTMMVMIIITIILLMYLITAKTQLQEGTKKIKKSLRRICEPTWTKKGRKYAGNVR
jgi:uncharacterized membrane protein